MASRFHSVFLLSLMSTLLIVRSVSNEVNVPVPGCPPDWTRFGSRCFIFQNRVKDMGDAERICISLGGNVASVHSAEEYMFLRELIHKTSGSYSTAWIGCYDGIKERTWMWTDGSKFDYQTWGSDEPNNNIGGEHCVEMNWRGQYWNDVPCSFGRPFVCVKDL